MTGAVVERERDVEALGGGGVGLTGDAVAGGAGGTVFEVLALGFVLALATRGVAAVGEALAVTRERDSVPDASEMTLHLWPHKSQILKRWPPPA